MRVLKFLLGWLFLLSILALVGFLITREVLLRFSISSLRHDLVALQEAEARGLYVAECASRGGQALADKPPVRYQLRFSSDNEYVLEAVCSQVRFDPILIDTGTLPPWTTKAPGQSGFVWEELRRTGVQVVVFGELAQGLERILPKSPVGLGFLTRSKFLVVDNRQIMTASQAELDWRHGPQTVCAGYGYACCDRVTQAGVGEQLVGLEDCPEHCFAECINRPTLLSFSSQPFFDPATRTVAISSGAQVEFAYVAQADDLDSLVARIDYGDGQWIELTDNQTQVTHVYECDRAECQYQVAITLIDDKGVESIVSPLSQLTVVVGGR